MTASTLAHLRLSHILKIQNNCRRLAFLWLIFLKVNDLVNYKKLTLIFVTKKITKFVYPSVLYLPPLLTLKTPLPLLTLNTFLQPSPLRNFVYTPLPFHRLKFCLAWQKLTKLMVLCTLLNKKEEKRVWFK